MHFINRCQLKPNDANPALCCCHVARLSTVQGVQRVAGVATLFGGVENQSERQWFTVEQAAAYLQVTKQTIYNWINLGILPYYELPTGRGRRFRREDLDRLLQRRGGDRLDGEAGGPPSSQS